MAEWLLNDLMQSARFAAQFEFLDEIRNFVGDIARRGGFSDKAVYNIQLATDEAASNIIEHAYKGVSNGVLELSCDVSNDAITIVLVDHGKPFDPSQIPAPDVKADLSKRKIGGLGLFLMRKLMDEVRYEAHPEQNRNVLTMIKYKE
ncbi:MAG TPA: ATP-binding protein [Anaerolineales bacterium]|nr:ATP-binding protein [Anaerolineales bacterium]